MSNHKNIIKILTERRTESSILRFEKNNGNFGAAKPLPGLLPNLWKQERSNLANFYVVWIIVSPIGYYRKCVE